MRDDVSISVLMAVHNGDRYLRAAMDSVLAQTYVDFEFVIVDDASQDRSASILAQYAHADKRVRVVRNDTNMGLTASLNRGLALCGGLYIARMDADDVCLPERLELQYEWMERHPELVALGCHVVQIDPAGIEIGIVQNPLEHDELRRRLFMGHGGVIPHPGVMLRKSVVEQIGGYDSTYRTAQDLDLYLKLSDVGRLDNLDRVLLKYRLHPTSTNNSRRELQLENARKIVQSAYQRNGLSLPEDWSYEWPNSDESDMWCRWGWNALRKGRRGIAFRHAFCAVRVSPFYGKPYRLLACCLRGR